MVFAGAQRVHRTGFRRLKPGGSLATAKLLSGKSPQKSDQIQEENGRIIFWNTLQACRFSMDALILNPRR